MNTMIRESTRTGQSLGSFLKHRRGKLDPAAFGFTRKRRRTPGLRREEVALRANISTTWYTWLEQGRGGAPSPSVLDRIGKALMLTDAEREHLFLLALGHTPDVRCQPTDAVPDYLRRVLDAMTYVPAIVTTAAWDVVAWNRAATAALTDYPKLAPSERNILRLIFFDPRVREILRESWEPEARRIVMMFRTNMIRVGITQRAQALIDELCERSPEFKALWEEGGVNSKRAGTKRMYRSEVGSYTLEYSTYAVNDRPELSLVVCNPVSAADMRRVQKLIECNP